MRLVRNLSVLMSCTIEASRTRLKKYILGSLSLNFLTAVNLWNVFLPYIYFIKKKKTWDFFFYHFWWKEVTTLWWLCIGTHVHYCIIKYSWLNHSQVLLKFFPGCLGSCILPRVSQCLFGILFCPFYQFFWDQNN